MTRAEGRALLLLLLLLDGFVGERLPSYKNVGHLRLWSNFKIPAGAHDRSPRRPFEEANIDERVDDKAAIISAQRP